MNTANNTTKVGFNAHNELVRNMLVEKTSIAVATNQALSSDYYLDLVVSSESLELVKQIDEDTYIREYVESIRAEMSAIGFNTKADVAERLEQANALMLERLGRVRYDIAQASYGTLIQKCYDALLATYE